MSEWIRVPGRCAIDDAARRVYAGVDVGLHVCFPCVIDLDRHVIEYPHSPGGLRLEDTVAWLAERAPVMIALDAPPGPNTGAMTRIRPHESPARRRVDEYCLSIGGCYGTPATEEAMVGTWAWMREGIRLYRALETQLGYAPDLGGTCNRLLETHPTYAFKALLGHRLREGGRILCDPARLLPPKYQPEGKQARITLLRRAMAELDITAVDASYWQCRLDWVDATMAAFIAAWRVIFPEQMRQIGDPEEGVLTLRMADWSVDLPPQEHAQPVAPQQPPRGGHHPQWVLRLGAQGPGGFTQQDTLHILRGELCSDAETWLPLDIGQAVVGLTHAIDAGDCELALAADRRVYARVRVQAIRSRATWDALTQEQRNPWVNAAGHIIGEARHWVRVSDLCECNLAANEIRTCQQGKWTPGFSPNQTALLRCQLPTRE